MTRLSIFNYPGDRDKSEDWHGEVKDSIPSSAFSEYKEIASQQVHLSFIIARPHLHQIHQLQHNDHTIHYVSTLYHHVIISWLFLKAS